MALVAAATGVSQLFDALATSIYYTRDRDQIPDAQNEQEQRFFMARYEKTLTLVHCAKYDEELPALGRKPFPGELGERIYNEISKLAWKSWQQQSTILINHYGLNLADPRAQEFLMEQMEEFLFGGGGPAVNMDPSTAAGGGAPRKK